MTQAANLASVASIIQAPTGTAPAYQCRAWVNFNGTGTVAIRASGNVSSITDIDTGKYVVNFITAMPDSSYSVSCAVAPSLTWNAPVLQPSSFSTTSIRVEHTESGTLSDSLNNCVAVFR